MTNTRTIIRKVYLVKAQNNQSFT